MMASKFLKLSSSSPSSSSSSVSHYFFPEGQTLDSSKLKEFADDHFNFDKNGRKFSKWVENTVEKKDEFFSHSAFKTLVLQTRKTGLVWDMVRFVTMSRNTANFETMVKFKLKCVTFNTLLKNHAREINI